MNLIKKSLLTCLLIGFFASVGNSQEIESFDLNTEEVREALQIERAETEVLISEGNNNLIFLEQVGVNKAAINIKGSYNDLFITQNGDANVMRIIQNGNFNILNASQTGSYNSTNVTQKGVHNLINSELVDSDFNQHTIIQEGSNLTLNHRLENAIGEGMEIKMLGNGMEISIVTKN